jgi:hypothetical protein
MGLTVKRTFHLALLALSLLGNAGCVKGPYPALLKQSDYRLSGSFIAGGVPPDTDWPRGEQPQFCVGSWSADERNPGTFVSSSFIAPANLIVFLSGYPSRRGNRLYLEDAGGSAQLALAVRNDPGQTWQRYVWEVPKNWRGHTIRLVADHDGTELQGWFGLTPPSGISGTARIEMSLSRVPVFLAIILLEGLGFLVPGLALAWLLESKYVFNKVQFVCLSLISSGAIGYLMFWVYLLSAQAGRMTSIIILLVSLATVVYAVKTRSRLSHFPQVAALALLMLLITTFYTALGFLYERSEDPPTQAELRFVHPLPIDNAIPYYFADKLYHGDPVRPFLLSGWKSSDRPPLQTGIALIEFPMWSFKTRGLEYQILGTFLQSMWVVPVWGLLTSFLPDRRATIAVLGFCVFSGFFLIHTFYIWPKFLAASYFLLALLVLGYGRGESGASSTWDAGIAGAAIGLALLSHGGVIFSLIALGIVLLVTRELPHWRSLASGVLLLSLFLLPWVIYQKFYDPPGDRLLKWHLAGVTELDSRPFRQLLVDAYSKPPISVILENKLQNIKTLFGPSPWRILRSGVNRASWTSLVGWYKGGSFFYFFQTLGVLNLGFFAFLGTRIFRTRPGLQELFRSIQRLLLLPAISLIVWCLLMYLPGSTLIHQGSLADVMLFFVTLGASLAVFWPHFTYVLLALQIFVLFPVFALTDMFAGPPSNSVWANGPDLGMLCLSLLSLLGIITFSGKIAVSVSCGGSA